jgi:hypothetical protein
MEKDIYDQLKEANIKIDSHYSDLYCPVTKESTAIINKYENRHNVTKFNSAIDDELWYDIPFAYKPYWEKKLQKVG